MKPINFPESNFTFQKPEGWTDEQCSPLSVCKTIDANKVPIIISKWELNAEELKEVNKTQSVYLIVCGTSTPPVSVHAITPFANNSGVASELINAIRVDPDLFEAYKSNIAMKVYDKFTSFYSENEKVVRKEDVHFLANNAAEHFLNDLINANDGTV